MILITGGTGQVGTSLISILAKDSQEFLAPSRLELSLDFPDKIEEFLQGKEFTAIVHLAAETNVDFCETNREMALLRNLESTKVLARAARDAEIPFIFISSSAVLSGDGEFMHSEECTFSPSNFYGHTKMEAEKFIRENCSNYLIIRASWMLGRGAQVKKFAEIAYEKIKANEEFSAVYDKFGSLTSASGLAHLISLALEGEYSDTVHYASYTSCSRYELAKQIKYALGSSSQIISVDSSQFELPAPRGFSEGLNTEKVEKLFGIKPRTWEEELDTFLEEL